MRLAQSHIVSHEGHRGTVRADTLHNKPDTPDVLGEEPSTGIPGILSMRGPISPSTGVRSSAPNILTAPSKHWCSKSLLSWSPQSPRSASSLVVLGSAVAAAVASSSTSQAWFSLICPGSELSFPFRIRVSSRPGGIGGRTLAANRGKIN